MADPNTWFEALGGDATTLRGFYGGLFGGKFASNVPQAVSKSRVTVYASVPDLKASIAQALQLGGRLLRPVVELSELSFAIISDPEGHAIGLLTHKA